MNTATVPYMGRLMFDIQGYTLTAEDKAMLAEPELGGLILFTRNYQSVEQVAELIRSIRAIKPQCLIAVDHEGGRVQRFKTSFTHLPAMAKLGALYDSQPDAALKLAHECGWLMAAELRCIDVDFSFAPVLDRDYGISAVIGDRAFSTDPDVIVRLAQSFTEGMREAGMAATGKHFPGHGGVAADSHIAIPIDARDEVQIFEQDMAIFTKLIDKGLEAIMPAHVIYSAVDPQPAGFSPYWLQKVLRDQLHFDGVIFSDDLSMEGATTAGTFTQRADAALSAGCDMVLVCNHREGAKQVLSWLKEQGDHASPHIQSRLRSMQARPFTTSSNLTGLQTTARVIAIRQAISTL